MKNNINNLSSSGVFTFNPYRGNFLSVHGKTFRANYDFMLFWQTSSSKNDTKTPVSEKIWLMVNEVFPAGKHELLSY
jgi:hypothetical protein